MNLESREAPGWVLHMSNLYTDEGYMTADVKLTHKGRFFGSGTCDRQIGPAPDDVQTETRLAKSRRQRLRHRGVGD